MTAADAAEGERIAETLVNEGLAACVNIVDGCRSVYRWKGKLVKDGEVLLIAKVSRAAFPDIERRVTDLHSYDVPEIIAVDLANVAPGYLAFLNDALDG
jgi:periplasmic divalent cation tolerance protein